MAFAFLGFGLSYTREINTANGQSPAVKPVLAWLVVLATVFGALAAAGQNRDVIDAALLSLGIDPDSWWFDKAVEASIYVLVGGPLLGLMSAVFALGHGKTTKDVHGYTVLRLNAGVRWSLSVASLGLAVLMLIVAGDEERAWVRFAFKGFGLAFLVGGWAIFRARIRFDSTSMYVRRLTLGEDRYDWLDLKRIESADDSSEYRLIFDGGRKVKLSHYYSGINGLIWLANERRRSNARTS